MSKKNAIVGQSGGPTAAINATLAGVFAAGKKLHTQTMIAYFTLRKHKPPLLRALNFIKSPMQYSRCRMGHWWLHR